MSKKTTSSKSSAATSHRFDAFTVREFEASGEKKSEWTRLGVAFPHADGKGFTVLLQAMPIDGKLTLRLHEPKDDNAG